MNICNEGHDEICHEGFRCPACELLSQIVSLENQVDEATNEVKRLESDLRDMADKEIDNG